MKGLRSKSPLPSVINAEVSTWWMPIQMIRKSRCWSTKGRRPHGAGDRAGPTLSANCKSEQTHEAVGVTFSANDDRCLGRKTESDVRRRDDAERSARKARRERSIEHGTQRPLP